MQKNSTMTTHNKLLISKVELCNEPNGKSVYIKRGHIWNEIQYDESIQLVSLSDLHSELFKSQAGDTDGLCLHSDPN